MRLLLSTVLFASCATGVAQPPPNYELRHQLPPPPPVPCQSTDTEKIEHGICATPNEICLSDDEVIRCGCMRNERWACSISAGERMRPLAAFGESPRSQHMLLLPGAPPSLYVDEMATIGGNLLLRLPIEAKGRRVIAPASYNRDVYVTYDDTAALPETPVCRSPPVGSAADVVVFGERALVRDDRLAKQPASMRALLWSMQAGHRSLLYPIGEPLDVTPDVFYRCEESGEIAWFGHVCRQRDDRLQLRPERIAVTTTKPQMRVRAFYDPSDVQPCPLPTTTSRETPAASVPTTPHELCSTAPAGKKIATLSVVARHERLPDSLDKWWHLLLGGEALAVDPRARNLYFAGNACVNEAGVGVVQRRHVTTKYLDKRCRTEVHETGGRKNSVYAVPNDVERVVVYEDRTVRTLESCIEREPPPDPDWR